MSTETTLTTDQILQQIAQTLSKPDRWIKGEMARTSPTGITVHTSNPYARCFCLLGARRRILGPNTVEPENASLRRLAEAATRLFPDRTKSDGPSVAFQHVAWFNDDPLTEHHDVLEVIAVARTIT